MKKHIVIAVSCGEASRCAALSHVSRFAEGLRATGVIVTIVHLGEWRDVACRGGVSGRLARLPFLRYGIVAVTQRTRGIRTLKYIVKNELPDAVIYYGRSGIVGRAVWRLCEGCGVSFLSFQVERHSITLRRLLNGSFIDEMYFRKKVLPNCDLMIGISSFWQAVGAKIGIPTTVIPALASFSSNVIANVTTNGRLKLLSLGGFGNRELPEVLLAALADAKKRGLSCEVTITYNKSSKRHERWRRRFLDLVDQQFKVNVVGWLTAVELESCLTEADVVVLLRENLPESRALFPTRLAEYAAYGKAILVSDVGDVGTYFQDGESALLLDSFCQAQSLSDKLLRLDEDRELLCKISRGARLVAARWFCPIANAEKLCHAMGW